MNSLKREQEGSSSKERRVPRNRASPAWWSTALVVTACFAGGCAKSDGLISVHGVVTYDGQPLNQSRILFRKIDGDQRGFGAPIENGEFRIRMQPGKMSVEISAWRPNGKILKEGDSVIRLSDQWLPPKYNTETKLTAEVDAESNDIAFHLTSE